MTDCRSPPNDRFLRLFCASPGPYYDYHRFIVEYPDYEYVTDHWAVMYNPQPLGECLTPPVLPQPCYWEVD